MACSTSPVRRSVSLSAAAVIALALIAACSSSGSPKSGSTSAGSTSGTSAAKPSGSPIKIGVIATTSGSQATGCNQGATVAPAWAEYVNQQLGGINGHPVQVIVKNDAGDPAVAQSVAKELVNDHVVALLDSCDNLLPAYENTFINAKIPVVSGPANLPDWYNKVGLYPLPTDLLSGLADQVAVGQKYGHAKKEANLYCSEVAACEQANPLQQAAATKLGVQFTSLAVSSTATSYTSQCLTLQQRKVDYAILSFVAPAGAKFIEDCQAQGYNPIFGTSSQSLGAKDLLEVKGATLYGVAYGFPSVADAPVVKTFVGEEKIRRLVETNVREMLTA